MAALPPSATTSGAAVERSGGSFTCVTAKGRTVRLTGVPLLVTSVAVRLICGLKPAVELFWFS
ncbi:MAG: hypothetical protein KJS91_02825, partial [Planctomycetes bacterium]|nr:hypothetical protein [Planctomycetota bacterium]